MQTKGQLSKDQSCFFVCTTFDSFLNDLLGYDIDVGLSNIVETSDIKPLDIVYICYDGMVLECVPPRISADAIFFSEKESVTYLWKRYIEYWPDFGIMLQ